MSMVAPREPDTDATILSFELRGGENKGIHRVLAGLIPNAKAPFPTAANALMILANDPMLSGMLGFNEFIQSPAILRAPPVGQDGDKELPGPYPRMWEDTEVALILTYIQRIWCAKMNDKALQQAMLAHASQKRFHPVRDWLKSLKWDGTKRLDHWLEHVFKVPNDEYHHAVASKILIAAVRRVMQPGCKFDQLLILEGNQGLGKSRVCRLLFGDSWFSDSIHPDFSSRDAAISLRGKWGVELAEIQHLIKNEVEVIKAFLSRPVDTYRPVNGKAIIDVPRQSILIGTTNTTDYLRDTTGNRRIWPVQCKDCRIEWLEKNRDQLWAEAVQRENSVETLWIGEIETQTLVEAQQVDRMADDSWTDPILEYLTGRADARVSDVMNNLGIPRAQQNRAQEMRVGGILRSLGWVSKQTRRGAAVVRVWHKPEG